MNTRKLLLVAVIVGLLTVGMSAVGAQNNPGDAGEPGGRRGLDMGMGDGFGRPDGRGGRGGPRGMRGFADGSIRQVLGIVADELGLDSADILAQLRDGMTLADIITANEGDVDAVIDTAVAALTDKINQAVTDGYVTQERADTLLANLEDLVTRGINGEFPHPFQERIRLVIGREILDLAAEQTGLESSTIREQLRSGTSLATILTENGVDVDEFIDAAVVQATERLDQAVENERITQERADELIRTFREQLTEHINLAETAEASV